MKEAFDFAKQVQAKKAIGVHYDKLGANPQVYAAFAQRFNFPFEIIVLERGASVEL
jgi:hypothetical protein